MAKRKRLSPAMLTADAPVTAPEVKSTRPPIADIANDAATTHALMELSDTISAARDQGRWIEQIPLDAIQTDYLVRDRTVVDADEMDALKASIRANGQQTAIEVVSNGPQSYGLISGWRRLTALRALSHEGGLDTVLAIVRQPDDAAAAYLAMVEENEIRSGLSFYERGRIVTKAVDEGAFGTDKAALAALFHAAPRAKRSKIGSFVRIVRALDNVLKFPTALSERSGLALAQALTDDANLAGRLQKQLGQTAAQSSATELAIVAAMIKGPARVATKPVVTSLPSGVECHVYAGGKVTLSGAALRDAAFVERLMQTLKSLE